MNLVDSSNSKLVKYFLSERLAAIMSMCIPGMFLNAKKEPTEMYTKYALQTPL
jgi:hypothetical protein